MTVRERWTAVLERSLPDRIPMTYRATEEAHEKLMRHLSCGSNAELHARLHIDNLASLRPAYTGPPVPDDQDLFGCTYRTVEYEHGVYRECVGHPLESAGSLAEIEASYTWPSVDWFDYSGVPAAAERARDRGCIGGGWEPFLEYKYMRGEEQAFMDLVENPDIVEYCMQNLFDFHYERTRRLFEHANGAILVSGSSEDLGSQTGLLYSPDHIRRFFLPHHRRMIDLMHEAGVRAEWHSDGSIREILPDLIQSGVDVLDPIQWRCNDMDRAGLKRDFGDDLIFQGAMDNQHTLPFGSTDDVAAEVLENIEILGAGGGYILGPCHNIQSVGPPENVVTMYEVAYENGWY